MCRCVWRSVNATDRWRLQTTQSQTCALQHFSNLPLSARHVPYRPSLCLCLFVNGKWTGVWNAISGVSGCISVSCLLNCTKEQSLSRANRASWVVRDDVSVCLPDRAVYHTSNTLRLGLGLGLVVHLWRVTLLPFVRCLLSFSALSVCGG